MTTIRARYKQVDLLLERFFDHLLYVQFGLYGKVYSSKFPSSYKLLTLLKITAEQKDTII